MPKNLTIASIVAPVILALFNTSIFGYQGLTSYFGFTIFALVVFLLSVYASDKILIPFPVFIFSGLVIYVSLHGVVLRNFNLTHYYWICSLVFLWAIAMNRENKIFAPMVFSVLSYTAAIESLIVLMQWMKWLPSKNDFFSCTGTWQNPNVTAMFLSMCIYAVLQKLTASKKKSFLYFTLTIILLAVVALQCRTAILAVLLFLIGHFMRKGSATNALIKKQNNLKPLLIIGCVLILFSLLLAFKFKIASTSGRLTVWKNSIQLILQKPISGYGIGMFEKEYNFFIAQHNNPSNDYVNMPYNDFLEFGVEGGIIAILLWFVFVVSVIYYRYKKNYSLLPVIAFLIIEITNFGFQAIPVFALFLLYCLLPENDGMKRKQAGNTLFC
ncbi:O-antigen ligase family protein [Pinibacter soli]|uniref:O-antigen ligase family protein n=1 Tax=Pinibacter soli TaxID=3044211 RepID=A0ABT6RJA0_9BACT|nr:O-antigen ligase family protein [Pinibacter soli]MDI3322531.1 O-antigen ligase family protein [Pinibacter soli]